MSALSVVEAAPDRARQVASFLAGCGVAGWPPGRTFASLRGGALVAVARLGLPSPGDGYHVEHVRSLDAAGEPAALTGVTVAAAAAARASRLEAETAVPPAGLESALASAGLAREVVLAEGWLPEGAARAVPLVGWGSVPGGVRPVVEEARPTVRAGEEAGRSPPPLPPGELRLEPSSKATRVALRAFLDGLAPGRSYPPGTLLSEAERSETRRSGDLDACWMLARTPDGAVVGGAVLQPDGRRERRHVRRVHLDVGPAWRGRGLATALLEAAAAHARELGIRFLEADPRSGNVGACRALRAAGFGLAGRERAAWRLRGGGPTRDEDVLVFVRSVCGGGGGSSAALDFGLRSLRATPSSPHSLTLVGLAVDPPALPATQAANGGRDRRP